MIWAPSTGWAFIDDPLLAGQPVRLEQDVVRHADLADVMEQAAPLERLELPGRCTRITRPMSTAISLHPLAVLARVRVALVHGLGQGPDRLREHLAHLDEALVRQPGRVERQREQERSSTSRRRARTCWAISHASGASASKFADAMPRACSANSRAGRPLVRRATTSETQYRLRTKYDHRLRRASLRGRWTALPDYPLNKLRRRSLRRSPGRRCQHGSPRSRTRGPAPELANLGCSDQSHPTGRGRTAKGHAAATSGAVDDGDLNAMRRTRTGRADAIRVMTIQNARPEDEPRRGSWSAVAVEGDRDCRVGRNTQGS